MYQKNRLKDLIYIQENKPCNEQTIKGLFRSIVEPILEENVSSLVLCRLSESSTNKFNNILKRLEFSNAKVYDFSDKPINVHFENILKEPIWNNTEFVFVLAERFGAVFVFDYDESDVENFAEIYTLYNSKNLSEAFEIINLNSKMDLKAYEDKWHPDRRNNTLLNNSIRKLLENLDETNQEVILSQLEKENVADSDASAKLDFILAKSSYIVHEMRNLFSICNLYSTIIDKQQAKIQFTDESVKGSIINARDCIKKSLQMAGNLLFDFKSMVNTDLKSHDLKKLIETALELSKIYGQGKEIEFTCLNNESVDVIVDENKFLTVLINLIKNAVESIEDKGDVILDTKINKETVNIIVSNTGFPIKKEIQENIFERGFTTKVTGSGLGLAICKKTLEEQSAELRLIKSDENSTDFEIKVIRG